MPDHASQRPTNADTAVDTAAYGVRLNGDLPADLLAVRGAGCWPALDVLCANEPSGDPATVSLSLLDGTHVSLDEANAIVRFCPAPGYDELVHPLLSVAAWMRARSMGREVLHAGAFAGTHGAWLVLAAKEGGKTTLLAQLHAAGVPVIADDLAILDNGKVFAGPRCLDLRADMAERLALGRPVRRDARHRVTLPPIDAEHRIAGVIELRWSDRESLDLIPGGERLRRLQAESGHRPRRDPSELLELATLPYYCLSRPRSAGDALSLLPDDVIPPAARVAPVPA